MCGIAGYIDFDGLDTGDARRRIAGMTDAIRHRGPDADGFFVDRHAALGHRRLAIIDLSAGHQPMAAADGQVQIVFNGEIYNYLDLRAELESLGQRFQTQSDTEVLLNGYLQWGEDLSRRLNGMYAFVIWDARSRSAFAARDRAGEKPFYWLRDGSRFAFASELHALRAGGFLAGRAVHPESLDCYLTLGYVPAPRTMLTGLWKLRPGQQMRIDVLGQQPRSYWSIPAGAPTPMTMEEALEEFEPLFDDAVKRQLMSDVPLGAFLSGGLDSALVVSSMARHSTRVITNTIGSGDPAFDERGLARQVAKVFGTEHHEHEVQPQADQVVGRIIGHLDEPIADPSVIPTWYVCEMTRRNVTVALSGDGGDEHFGGYTFRYAPHVAEARLRARLPAAVRAPIFGALHRLWPRSRRLPRPLRLGTIFGNLALSDAGAYCEDLAWLKGDVRGQIYAPAFIDELLGFSAREVVQPFYEYGEGDPLLRCQRADQQTYMTDDVLVKVDRMSMAHALETRAPLLDHRIREFAMRLPPGHRLDGQRGKPLLRALAVRRLPAVVTDAPKRGFSINMAQWLRGELREFARERIFAPGGLLGGRLDQAALRRLWDQHQSGARDHSAVLWGLTVITEWQRR